MPLEKTHWELSKEKLISLPGAVAISKGSHEK